MKKIIISILLTITSISALAIPYQINILIFEHLLSKNITLAHAYNKPNFNITVPKNSIDLSAVPTTGITSQLTDITNKISQHPDYKIILNKAWQQEIVDDSSTTYNFQINNKELSRFISLNKYNYINFKTNLVLHTKYGDFTIKQSRRLKENELNYIDNPLCGILIQINQAPTNHTQLPNPGV
ncbi:MAG: hypothetical protein JXR42_00505 [Gammaproteobacteria bacterium]|nr:hypothetical protein [Gammaproteobacteria bacterium]